MSSVLLTRELLARAWDARPPELGPVELLAPRVLLPVMRWDPPGAGTAGWQQLCAVWQQLAPHAHILALTGTQGDAARLQFALLDFRATPGDDRDRPRQARQLVAAFEHIATDVPREQWWLFARPRVFVDLEGAVRLAFLPPLASEGPIVLERVIALAWLRFCPADPDAITRADVASAARAPADPDAWRDLNAWRAVEAGVGLLMADRPHPARSHLESAQRLWPWSSLVESALTACDGELALTEVFDSERDFIEALHWSERDPAYAELYAFDAGRLVPAMMYKPARASAHWEALRNTWRMLPMHDVVLDALSIDTDGRLVLRFAAIAWQTPLAGRHALALAGELVAAYRHIVRWVPEDRWWLFLEPRLHLDVSGHLRVAFEPPAVKPTAPVTQATFVELVAILLLDRAGAEASSLRAPLEQCLDRGRRFASLELLANELVGTERHGQSHWLSRQWDAWSRAEEGLGLLLLERVADARDAFEWADFTRSNLLTRWGLQYCDERLGPRAEPEAFERAGWVPLAWSTAEPIIRDLEAVRDLTEALRIYDQVEPSSDERAAVATSRARCHLEARQVQHAIQWAQTALVAAPAQVDAHRILVRALIEHRAYAEGLRQGDMLLSALPHDPVAHYLRGKALLGLRRLDEARDAFDLAIALRPTLGEALLLRREAARLLKALGKDVGTQRVLIDIPPSLEPLRDTLLGGRARAILEALSAPSLASDAAAQLMLARFLGFEGQHERALAIYERLVDGPHRAAALVGTAACLHGQGSHESALAILDATTVEIPQSIDACELRARVLAALGRIGEAAAEFRRFVQLGTARSDVRVRAAQLWLDAH